MTNEYKAWLERMIEQCHDVKDLQREHWAFCQALKRYKQEEEAQLPQQEISDEEIEKASKEFWGEEIGNGIWSMGAKWYREQLKNK